MAEYKGFRLEQEGGSVRVWAESDAAKDALRAEMGGRLPPGGYFGSLPGTVDDVKEMVDDTLAEVAKESAPPPVAETRARRREREKREAKDTPERDEKGQFVSSIAEEAEKKPKPARAPRAKRVTKKQRTYLEKLAKRSGLQSWEAAMAAKHGMTLREARRKGTQEQAHETIQWILEGGHRQIPNLEFEPDEVTLAELNAAWDARPDPAKLRDLARTSKRVVAPDASSPRGRAQLEEWLENPAALDVRGIDDHDTGVDMLAGEGAVQLVEKRVEVEVPVEVVKEVEVVREIPVEVPVMRDFVRGDAPKGVGGETTAFSISDPRDQYAMRWRLLDMKDVIASHTTMFEENPRYDQELQPRDRGKVMAKNIVRKNASRMAPDLLLRDTGALDVGPPIVGPDFMVESGNGRFIAMQIASEENPDIWARYQKSLRDRAASYGFDETDFEGLANPVLVRERTANVNRLDFVAEANHAPIQEMGIVETARADSKRLPLSTLGELQQVEGSLADALRAQANAPIVASVMQLVPLNDQTKLIDEDLKLSPLGIERVKSTLFYATFPGESGDRLTEAFFGTDDEVALNMKKGLENSLPTLGVLRAKTQAGTTHPELDISEDLAVAVDHYLRVKNQGMSVDWYLRQPSFGGVGASGLTDSQKELMKAVEAYKGTPGRMADFIRAYGQWAIALPDPKQAGFFGGGEQVDWNARKKQELLRAFSETRPERAEESFYDVDAITALSEHVDPTAPLVAQIPTGPQYPELVSFRRGQREYRVNLLTGEVTETRLRLPEQRSERESFTTIRHTQIEPPRREVDIGEGGVVVIEDGAITEIREPVRAGASMLAPEEPLAPPTPITPEPEMAPMEAQEPIALEPETPPEIGLLSLRLGERTPSETKPDPKEYLDTREPLPAFTALEARRIPNQYMSEHLVAWKHLVHERAAEKAKADALAAGVEPRLAEKIASHMGREAWVPFQNVETELYNESKLRSERGRENAARKGLVVKLYGGELDDLPAYNTEIFDDAVRKAKDFQAKEMPEQTAPRGRGGLVVDIGGGIRQDTPEIVEFALEGKRHRVNLRTGASDVVGSAPSGESPSDSYRVVRRSADGAPRKRKVVVNGSEVAFRNGEIAEIKSIAERTRSRRAPVMRERAIAG